MSEIQFLPAKPILVLRIPFNEHDNVDFFMTHLKRRIKGYYHIAVMDAVTSPTFEIVSIKEATPEMISEIKLAIDKMERIKK